MNKTLKATHEGNLQIGDITLSVAVLNDGTRVISQNTLFKAFGRPVRGSRSKGDQDTPKLPGLIDAKNLKPFISNDLVGVINLVDYKNLNGTKTSGYNANILPLICEVYIEANDAKDKDGKSVLTKKQMPNYVSAKVLLRSLYRVSIIALVDEATGYQYERNRNELQVILKAYISEELLKWQKRFPDSFYQEMFRLRGWDYDVENIKKRPGVIGTWTNNLIYKQLPSGVLKELKERTPKDESGHRKHRFHQLLTEDIGNPHLSNQITAVVTLMRASATWRNFERLFARAFGQQEMDFGDSE